MPLPPHFKFIIPGAIFTFEGGTVLVLGLLYSALFQLGGTYGGNLLVAIFSIFILVGIISLCIGVPLLIVGLVRRSQYAGYSPSRSRYRGHIY